MLGETRGDIGRHRDRTTLDKIDMNENDLQGARQQPPAPVHQERHHVDNSSRPVQHPGVHIDLIMLHEFVVIAQVMLNGEQTQLPFRTINVVYTDFSYQGIGSR